MQTWAIQDAKARFSEFLEACMVDGPQLVTKRGSEAAVLVSSRYIRLNPPAPPAAAERCPVLAPAIRRAPHRPATAL